MSDSTQIVIAIMVFLGGSGGIVAGVRAFMDRSKVKADTVQIITNAAGSQVDRMDKRLERLEKRTEEQGDEIRHLSDYQNEVSHWAIRHRPFDMQAREIARRHGDALPVLEDFPEFQEWHPARA